MCVYIIICVCIIMCIHSNMCMHVYYTHLYIHSIIYTYYKVYTLCIPYNMCMHYNTCYIMHIPYMCIHYNKRIHYNMRVCVLSLLVQADGSQGGLHLWPVHLPGQPLRCGCRQGASLPGLLAGCCSEPGQRGFCCLIVGSSLPQRCLIINPVCFQMCRVNDQIKSV